MTVDMEDKILLNQYNDLVKEFTEEAFNYFGNRLSDKNFSDKYRRQNLYLFLYNRFREHSHKLDYTYYDQLIDDIYHVTSNTIIKDNRPILSGEDFHLAKKNLLAQMAEKFGSKLDILENAPRELMDDEEIIKFAMTKHSLSYRCASDRLRSDKDLAFHCVNIYSSMLQHVNDPLQDNRELVLLSVKSNNIDRGDSIQYASERLKDDIEIASISVSKYGENLKYVSERLKDNEEVVTLAIEQTGLALKHASDRLKSNRELILKAVTNCGWVLESLTLESKDDKEIVMAACKSKNLTLKHASNRLKDDKEVVLIAIEKDYEAFKDCSYRLRNDREIILKAVEKHGRMIIYGPGRSSFDKEIGLAAVKSFPEAIKYLSIALRRDKEIANIAVKGNQFIHISERLKHNKPYVLELINKRHNIYQELPNILKNDKDVIFAAVKELRIIKELSQELRNDKKLALIAVENYPYPHYDETEEERNESLLDLLGNDLQEEIGQNNPITYLKTYLLKEAIEKKIIQQELNDVNIIKNEHRKMKI